VGRWVVGGGRAVGTRHTLRFVSEIPAELVALRASIDNLDAALVHLLAERFRCTQTVGHLKARLGLPPSDPDREVAQMARLRELAEESGLDPAFAEKFLAFVIAEVIRNHGTIAQQSVRTAD
jgi:chorismate mutase